MRLSILSIAVFSIITASSAHAENATSHFSVLDVGQIAVEAELTGTKRNGDEIARSTSVLLSDGRPAFSGAFRSYSSSLFANTYIGLGNNFELSASLPYIIRNYTETSFNNGVDYVHNKDGFSDLSLGLKYRAFNSADGNDAVLFKGAVMHHSSSVGNIHVDVDYLHVFSSSVKAGIDLYYNKAQGNADSFGATNYLMFEVSPVISITPFASIGRQQNHAVYSPYNYYSGGLELSYIPARTWRITPEISFLHINEIYNNFFANNSGPQHSLTGTFFVRKTF
ncbi:hypothetical protein ACO0K7_17440 [Undibacterium sp. Ji67W]|uniref:hypothetical protein n=1 Tax=Undibacterium sp. Ji67W TaxID=3413042 RepID=UPI003BEF6C58